MHMREYYGPTFRLGMEAHYDRVGRRAAPPWDWWNHSGSVDSPARTRPRHPEEGIKGAASRDLGVLVYRLMHPFKAKWGGG